MGFPAPPFGASPQGPPTTTTVRYPAPAYPPWAMAPPRMPDGGMGGRRRNRMAHVRVRSGAGPDGDRKGSGFPVIRTGTRGFEPRSEAPKASSLVLTSRPAPP